MLKMNLCIDSMQSVHWFNQCIDSIYIDQVKKFIEANSHNHDKLGNVTMFELNGESIKIFNGFTHGFKRNIKHGIFGNV